MSASPIVELRKVRVVEDADQFQIALLRGDVDGDFAFQGVTGGAGADREQVDDGGVAAAARGVEEKSVDVDELDWK